MKSTTPLVFWCLVGCGPEHGNHADDGGPGLGTAAQTPGGGTTGPPSPLDGPNLSTDGSSEQCVLLFGETDRIVGSDDFLPFDARPRTVQAWIRTNDPFSDQIIAGYGRGAAGRGFLIGVDNGRAWVSVAGSTRVIGSTDVADDEWHHIAGGWDGDQSAIMVDGLVEGNGNFAGDTIAGNFTVGNSPESGVEFLPFIGWVDDVKVFDIARDPAEVAADSDGILSPEHLVLHWDFEVGPDASGIGVVVEDSSVNNNVGIAAGVSGHPQFPACR